MAHWHMLFRRRMPRVPPLVIALLTMVGAAHGASPDPSAPLVELGAGVVGSGLGYAVGLPLVGYCAHGSCRDAIVPALGILGSVGAAGGVILAGSAYPRYGSVGGAFLGSACGMAVTGGLFFLLTRPGIGSESGSSNGVSLLITGLLLPSLGATFGYEAFRDRSRAASASATSALTSPYMLTIGPVAF